ncbi:hypothetical protein ABN154_30310 [Klebsiella michiganensis]|uniref:hypothetical protein n=1 Tax=Klebsiella michiganensis TaxID=1134687 RepID=UPI0032DB504A
MKIELDVIEKAIAIVFEQMKCRGLSSVELDSDFYWNIPIEHLYNVYSEPVELDIGQLTDDYETLKKNTEDDMLTHCSLKNVAAIMRFLSQYHSVNSEISTRDEKKDTF